MHKSNAYKTANGRSVLLVLIQPDTTMKHHQKYQQHYHQVAFKSQNSNTRPSVNEALQYLMISVATVAQTIIRHSLQSCDHGQLTYSQHAQWSIPYSSTLQILYALYC